MVALSLYSNVAITTPNNSIQQYLIKGSWRVTPDLAGENYLIEIPHNLGTHFYALLLSHFTSNNARNARS
jgi:hypothetical protein